MKYHNHINNIVCRSYVKRDGIKIRCFVIVNPSRVILNPSSVILNKVKNLIVHAQGKLREESRCHAQGKRSEESSLSAQDRLREESRCYAQDKHFGESLNVYAL